MDKAVDQVVDAVVTPAQSFSKESLRLLKRCSKPDRNEFKKIAIATGVGFAVMGLIGYFVKLIHIPINQLIIGGN